MSLTQEELRFLEILKDPVEWAKWELGVEPREYQEEILRSPSKRKCLRMGRRCGKTWTLAVQALWYAFTHAESTQIIVTPYQNQVDFIFDEIRNSIAKSRSMAGSVEESTKSPHYIKFTNGAKLKGFTSGVRTGNEAASLRGQRADWVYMDEVDYMSDKDFETVYAIALEDPNRIGVWCSSTPSGRRGMFWKINTTPELRWQVFHYPTMVVPNWDTEMEAELRATFSHNGYIHDVLAEFGTEEGGVYPKDAIDECKKDYHYVDRSLSSAIRIAGVDWDKYGAGTQIVVVEYNELRDKFIVINRIEIPIGEFTLDNGIRKIIEINKLYDLKYIYVDRGYGEHQVEVLHKYGIEHPESGLHEKVVGVSFSETTNTTDPFTRQVVKAQIKPYMVNQLCVLLERRRIQLNSNDKTIWKQLEDYHIERINQNGMPVYGSENEHSHDALALAILGFAQKYPRIVKVAPILEHMNKITIINNDKLYARTEYEYEEDKIRKDWDEPGAPPLRKVSGYARRPNPNMVVPRGRTSLKDLDRAFSRKFWER